MWALVLMLLIAPCLVGIAGPWINKAFNYNGITLMILCLAQFSVAFYFLYQARAYLKPIMLYLAQEEERRRPLEPTDEGEQQRQRSPNSTQHQQSMRTARTEYLVKWISLSAAFMILNSFSLVLLWHLYTFPFQCDATFEQCTGRVTPTSFLALQVFQCSTRIYVSYTQVRSVKRLSDPSTSKTLLKWVFGVYQSTKDQLSRTWSWSTRSLRSRSTPGSTIDTGELRSGQQDDPDAARQGDSDGSDNSRRDHRAVERSVTSTDQPLPTLPEENVHASSTSSWLTWRIDTENQGNATSGDDPQGSSSSVEKSKGSSDNNNSGVTGETWQFNSNDDLHSLPECLSSGLSPAVPSLHSLPSPPPGDDVSGSDLVSSLTLTQTSQSETTGAANGNGISSRTQTPSETTHGGRSLPQPEPDPEAEPEPEPEPDSGP